MSTRKQYFECFVSGFGFYEGFRSTNIEAAFEYIKSKVRPDVVFYILDPANGKEYDEKKLTREI